MKLFSIKVIYIILQVTYLVTCSEDAENASDDDENDMEGENEDQGDHEDGGRPENGDQEGQKNLSDDPQATDSPELSPTVISFEGFDAADDAKALRKAMKGFGTNEKMLINILTKRVNSQRQQIASKYEKLYGKELRDVIKSETSKSFEDVLVALLTPLPQYYAAELHRARGLVGTKGDVLIEILCTASNDEIRLINEAYKRLYGKDLSKNIGSGIIRTEFKRLMSALSLGNRKESSEVDPDAARQDAEDLADAGVRIKGTNGTVFREIFTTRSRAELKLIFQQYKNITGQSMSKAIAKEFSGDIKAAYLAIIQSIKDRAAFFAERLHKSMKGIGTKDRSLIRLIVTHCESDLGEIKATFQTKYLKTLKAKVAEETSGDYKRALLALIG